MQKNRKRVVITGIGILTKTGTSKDALWDAVLGGNSFAGVSNLLSEVNSIPVKIACEIKELPTLAPRTMMRLDRQGVLSFVSAQAAIEDSKLKIDENLSYNTGVFEGTALASMNTNFERHTKYMHDGFRKISPLALLNGLTGNSSGMIAQEYCIHGPALTYSNACVSSAYAVGYGFRKIQNGELDVAVSGGAEAPVSTEIIGLFAKAKLVSENNDDPQNACKPFDSNRDGFVMGEGGAYLVLEELEHALRRNAKIYAELIGFGESSDAYHGSSPEPGGMFYALAMKQALSDGSLTANQIDYINVHGTATKLNDPAESIAIKSIFGSVPVSSTKQITGHLLGACGSMELAITCMALENNVLPPVKTLKDPDSECDINIIREPVQREINYAMSNNLSFGGRNSSIIIGKFKGEQPCYLNQ